MVPKEKLQDEETTQAAVERINRIAYILKGIGHSVRLRIISALSDGGERAVNDLRDELEVEQTVLSHHLAKMRDLGLLTTRRDGKQIYYSLKDDQIAYIIDCMQKCDIF